MNIVQLPISNERRLQEAIDALPVRSILINITDASIGLIVKDPDDPTKKKRLLLNGKGLAGSSAGGATATDLGIDEEIFYLDELNRICVRPTAKLDIDALKAKVLESTVDGNTWSAQKLIGETTENKTILLLCKRSEEENPDFLIGGEIIEVGEGVESHYQLSLAANGSRFLKGATNNKAKAKVCLVQLGSSYYYGLHFIDSKPAKVYHVGWFNEDAALPKDYDDDKFLFVYDLDDDSQANTCIIDAPGAADYPTHFFADLQSLPNGKKVSICNFLKPWHGGECLSPNYSNLYRDDLRANRANYPRTLRFYNKISHNINSKNKTGVTDVASSGFSVSSAGPIRAAKLVEESLPWPRFYAGYPYDLTQYSYLGFALEDYDAPYVDEYGNKCFTHSYKLKELDNGIKNKNATIENPGYGISYCPNLSTGTAKLSFKPFEVSQNASKNDKIVSSVDEAKNPLLEIAIYDDNNKWFDKFGYMLFTGKGSIMFKMELPVGVRHIDTLTMLLPSLCPTLKVSLLGSVNGVPDKTNVIGSYSRLGELSSFKGICGPDDSNYPWTGQLKGPGSTDPIRKSVFNQGFIKLDLPKDSSLNNGIYFIEVSSGDYAFDLSVEELEEAYAEYRPLNKLGHLVYSRYLSDGTTENEDLYGTYSFLSDLGFGLCITNLYAYSGASYGNAGTKALSISRCFTDGSNSDMTICNDTEINHYNGGVGYDPATSGISGQLASASLGYWLPNSNNRKSSFSTGIAIGCISEASIALCNDTSKNGSWLLYFEPRGYLCNSIPTANIGSFFIDSEHSLLVYSALKNEYSILDDSLMLQQVSSKLNTSNSPITVLAAGQYWYTTGSQSCFFIGGSKLKPCVSNGQLKMLPYDSMDAIFLEAVDKNDVLQGKTTNKSVAIIAPSLHFENQGVYTVLLDTILSEGYGSIDDFGGQIAGMAALVFAPEYSFKVSSDFEDCTINSISDLRACVESAQSCNEQVWLKDSESFNCLSELDPENDGYTKLNSNVTSLKAHEAANHKGYNWLYSVKYNFNISVDSATHKDYCVMFIPFDANGNIVYNTCYYNSNSQNAQNSLQPQFLRIASDTNAKTNFKRLMHLTFVDAKVTEDQVYDFARRISNLSNTGVNGAPHVIIPSGGTLDKQDLIELASACHNKEKQLIVDLSACVINAGIANWNEDKDLNKLFQNCESLSEFKFPKGVVDGGSATFSGCKYLKNVVLPDSLESLGGIGYDDESCGCFSGTQVEELWLPKGFYKFGNYMFANSNIRRAYITSLNKDTLLSNIATPEALVGKRYNFRAYVSTFNNARSDLKIMLPCKKLENGEWDNSFEWVYNVWSKTSYTGNLPPDPEPEEDPEENIEDPENN